jgi:hypothetical protein
MQLWEANLTKIGQLEAFLKLKAKLNHYKTTSVTITTAMAVNKVLTKISKDDTIQQINHLRLLMVEKQLSLKNQGQMKL